MFRTGIVIFRNVIAKECSEAGGLAAVKNSFFSGQRSAVSGQQKANRSCATRNDGDFLVWIQGAQKGLGLGVGRSHKFFWSCQHH
jgi:hypothetical protein